MIRISRRRVIGYSVIHALFRRGAQQLEPINTSYVLELNLTEINKFRIKEICEKIRRTVKLEKAMPQNTVYFFYGYLYIKAMWKI